MAHYLPYCLPTEFLGFAIFRSDLKHDLFYLDEPTNDNYRTGYLLDAGCSCHRNPPCSFCTSLTEEEANIYGSHGPEGLAAYRHHQGLGDTHVE